MPTLRSFLACAAASFAAAHFAIGADEKSTTAPAPAEKADVQAAPAAEPQKAGAPAAAPAPVTVGPTVVLPEFQVTGGRLRAIENKIKRVEKQIKREKKALARNPVNETINSDKLAQAAMVFGGNSASHLAALAAARIESLEKELSMLETLRTPLTAEQRTLLEKEIEEQRRYRRELDQVR